MSSCPLCYSGMSENRCEFCGISLSEEEMIKLKAKTYDSIINHLTQSGLDARRREQIRTKIALKNIKKWAHDNFETLIRQLD